MKGLFFDRFSSCDRIRTRCHGNCGTAALLFLIDFFSGLLLKCILAETEILTLALEQAARAGKPDNVAATFLLPASEDMCSVNDDATKLNVIPNVLLHLAGRRQPTSLTVFS